MTRRGYLAWAAVTVAVAAAALLVWHIRPRGPQQGGGEGHSAEAAQPVGVATVATGDIALTLGALGTVTPLATVTVKTQINGQLTKVAFHEGQYVDKGDFLAQIDPRPYQAALEQAEGQLLKDQALLRNARIDLARYRTLVVQDSIARQQADTQDALVQQYEGTVKTDQGLVDTARVNLDYCRLVAPVSGRVGLRLVDEGNFVQTSDAGGIVVITQLRPITVIFELPEDDLPAVMKRVRGGATLAVDAYDRGGNTELATGTLHAVDNQIDTTTGTVKMRAEFANDDGTLFPNQFVNIKIRLDVLRDVTVVPSAAIQEGAPGTFVYRVNAVHTVSVQRIAVGPAEGERTSVRSGLKSGDVVVVDGADRLRDGARVTVPAAPVSAKPTEPRADK